VAVQQVERDTNQLQVNQLQVVKESHIQVGHQGVYSEEVRHQDAYNKECTYTNK